MFMDFESLATPYIKNLKPYVPGKPIEALERELGIKNIIKLASNENPLGVSPRAAQVLRDFIAQTSLYPDGDCYTLKKVLALHLAVTENQLLIGNGSNEIIEILVRLFAGPGKEVIISQYAFAIYEIAAQAIGATIKVVPARQWGHDLTAMLQAVTVATTLIFIANPNNPTGTFLTRDELSEFLAKVPSRVLVVLDEAYFEYVQTPHYPDGIPLIALYPNVVVLRTFSKIYGLAGLRVGYGVAHEQVATLFHKMRQPFNVNSFAQVAAQAALDDHDFVSQSRQINQQGLVQLAQGFAQLGLQYIPSVANFVTVAVAPSGREVFQQLLTHGVIVRPLDNYLMPGYIRVTVGLREQNQRFLAALAQIIAC